MLGQHVLRRGAHADGEADRSYRRSRASSGPGRLELFDEGPPGFCIRITPNDRRTACVFYRVGSRLRRATLGTLPPLTLADARELAREALRDAALGHDPASASARPVRR